MKMSCRRRQQEGPGCQRVTSQAAQVDVDWEPAAKVVVEGPDSPPVVQWQFSAIKDTRLNKEQVLQKFRAKVDPAANIQWSL